MAKTVFDVRERGLYFRGICRSQKLIEQAVALSELFAQRVALVFETGDFAAHALGFGKERAIFLGSFHRRAVGSNADTGFLEKILEHGVHGLEPVGILGVIAQQYVVLEKIKIVAAAVEKHQAVLQHFIIGVFL